MERSKVIFGNPIAAKDYTKACRQKAKYQKKFGDDSGTEYYFAAAENPVLAPIGVKNLVLTDKPGLKLPDNALIVGNIRMGYGHYRISMAIASAAHALGFEPPPERPVLPRLPAEPEDRPVQQAGVGAHQLRGLPQADLQRRRPEER